jgi:hypothetical protein
MYTRTSNTKFNLDPSGISGYDRETDLTIPSSFHTGHAKQSAYYVIYECRMLTDKSMELVWLLDSMQYRYSQANL